MIFDITDKMRLRAEQYEAAVLKNLIHEPNYTEMEYDRRYFIGYVGECVFGSFLRLANLKFEWKEKKDGKSGEQDFLLFKQNGNPVTVDVKTNRKITNPYLLLNDKMYNKYTYDVYVLVRLFKGFYKGIVDGWCTKAEFQFKPDGFTEKKLPTWYRHMDLLRPLQPLADKLMKIIP